MIAGDDGLQVVDRILHEAHDYLTPNGILVVEVGNSAQALIEKYPKLPLYWLVSRRGRRGVFIDRPRFNSAYKVRKYNETL